VPAPPISAAPDVALSPDMEANQAANQAKMRNIDRQKQLVEDTQKLLALANELKADVDKSTKDTLSLDVVRKADEIEKLAHSVKEKMKNAT
jgi:nitric oxide reductase activation protein